MEELTFEEAYAQLEQAVEALESGNLPLADALAVFERGTQLASLCDGLLNDAELKVRQVVSDGAGGFEAVPFEDWEAES